MNVGRFTLRTTILNTNEGTADPTTGSIDVSSDLSVISCPDSVVRTGKGTIFTIRFNSSGLAMHCGEVTIQNNGTVLRTAFSHSW